MGVGARGENGLKVRSKDVRTLTVPYMVPSHCDMMNLLKKRGKKGEKKTVNIKIALLEFTCTYPRYRRYRSQCAAVCQNRELYPNPHYPFWKHRGFTRTCVQP